MFVTAIAALQQDQPTPAPAQDGGMGGMVIFFLILAAVIGGVLLYQRAESKWAAAMLALGLRPIGDRLPMGFPPPSNAWMPEAKVGKCFAGVHNGFEAAVFRLQFQGGESATYRNIIAVRRDGFTPNLSPFIAQFADLDTRSSPGWVLVAQRGSRPRLEVARAILQSLTA